MAIALRSTPQTAITSTTVTSLACNVPTVDNGNVLVLAVTYRNQGTWTPPSGWTEAPHSPGTRTTTSTLRVLTRVASSEPSSYTATIGTAAQISMFIAAYSGVSTSAPVDSDGFQGNASNVNQTAPTITTIADNCMLLLICSIEGTATWTSDAAMTEEVDIASSAGAARNALTYDDLLLGAHGATGTHTAVASGANPGIGYHLALAPTVVAGLVAVQYQANQAVKRAAYY